VRRSNEKISSNQPDTFVPLPIGGSAPFEHPGVGHFTLPLKAREDMGPWPRQAVETNEFLRSPWFLLGTGLGPASARAQRGRLFWSSPERGVPLINGGEAG